jgi:subtilisin family serine protease
MSRLTHMWRHACFFAAVSFACAAGGCGDDDASHGTDSGADSSPDADADADGGADAGSDAGRGDPADFPTDCLATCEEACARLDECGGASNTNYPMALDECNAMCAIAMNGSYWDDVSGNFRCCASQESCADVAGCGGWLDHGDLDGQCTTLCDCMFGVRDMGALRSTHVPPAGYVWAPSTVVVDPGDETADYEARYGASVVQRGRYAVLRFKDSALADYTAYRVGKHETALPTFVDTAGRIAAAVGNIVIEATDASAITAAKDLVGRKGFASVQELPWSKGRLRLAEGGDPWVSIDILHELNQIPGVRAELDMLRIYEKRLTPNDPMFGDQWHLLNDGQADPEVAGGPQLSISGADSRVAEAWDVTTGDPSIVISIFDDGVNINHPDIAGNALTPYNYPDDWESHFVGTPYVDALGGHGTECAGVAAAEGNNGIGVSGVCPNCALLPALLWDPASGDDGLPTGGSFQATDAVLASLFTGIVDLGAAVISNSWGPAGEDPSVESTASTPPALSTVMTNAFEYAETDGRAGLGTLIVYAAGNSNQDCDNDTYAAYENVVNVGAVDDQGLKSYYSNYGSSLDVAAPSNGGKNGITTIATSGNGDDATNPTYDYEFGGTSSACPFAAGVVGLILSANPALTAAQVRQILADSATEIDPVWGDWADGFSPYYGNGLINAFRAVQMANGTCTDPATCFAPSDAAAASGEACASCRTDNECADGYACQPLPELGIQVCVEKVETTTCATDFTYANGYCLPTRTACGLCTDEVCNSRDDDCDGVIDNGLTDCDITARCMQDGWGCPDGTGCAATVCQTTCADATQCGDGEECVHVKTRYGAIDATTSVCFGGDMGCQEGCTVLVSSLDDAELAEFVDCVNTATSCSAIYSECAALLPVGK